MKVAYLILAHHLPELTAHLVRSLTCDWATFFIHVDLKADIAPFRALLADHPGVRFLSGQRRIKVSWGGFSLVQATLNLLTEATQTGTFDRYCLLSGMDAPIKPLAAIRERLAGGQEFLRVDRRLSDPVGKNHGLAIRRYYFLDLPIPRRLNLWLLSGRIPRLTPPPIPIYHGANWWCLTAACVGFLLDFVSRNPGYLAYHRYTRIPDETFFHSLIKQSPFAERISHDFEQASSLADFFAANDHGCHYIDWNAAGKVLPKVLTLDDLPALQRSPSLFARKFDPIRSRDLLQVLEREAGEG